MGLRYFVSSSGILFGAGSWRRSTHAEGKQGARGSSVSPSPRDSSVSEHNAHGGTRDGSGHVITLAQKPHGPFRDDGVQLKSKTWL